VVSLFVIGSVASAYDLGLGELLHRICHVPRIYERSARWGEDNYRGYVGRPDIQVRLKQLGQLLGAKKIVPRAR
jgi:hypothetical protein